ncbi:MAG: hypothetical protein WBA09_22390 [Candidatus Acidiferrum sp.]
MIKRLLILLLLSASPLLAATHYISKSLGADSNAGTSKASPWAHLPGMGSCTSNCSSYSPGSGDQFILYGGDTWTSSDLGVSWQWNGTSGSPIYIGVDETWYNSSICGASFCRPIWNCSGTTCSNTSTANAMFQLGGGGAGNYVTLDNIEMTGRSTSDDRGYVQVYSSNVLIENIYVHGWTHSGETNDSGFGFTSSTCCGGGLNVVFDHDIADGSDTTQNSLACFFGGIGIIEHSLCNYVTNGAEGSFDQIHDSMFENIELSFQAGAHQNAIQQSGPTSSTSNTFFYNNVITGVATGGITKLWVGQSTGAPQTAYVFDNVMYNNAAGNDVDVCQEGSNCGTYYYFNNTFECGNASGVDDCQAGSGSGYPTQVAYWINNHCIATSCSNVSLSTYTLHQSNSLIQSVSTASGQGYTAGSTYAFQPTLVTGGTVTAGTNEQSLCTTINGIDTTAGAACQNDTGYACSYNTSNHTLSCPDRSVKARPSSTAWDIGAYQYSASGGASVTIQGSVTIKGATTIQP